MIADQDENLIEFLNKRLRNQRKRLLKITKYEQLAIDTLNADQIETLARKQEVTSTIKELEDTLVKATFQDKKNEEQLSKLLNQHELELKAKVQEAKDFTFKSTRDELRHLLIINHALSLPTTLLIKQHPINQSEFNALMVITKLITRKPENSKEYYQLISVEKDVYVIGDCMQKMFQGSQEIVPETELSFKEIDLLIKKLLMPPPQGPVFGVQEEESTGTVNADVASGVMSPAIALVFKAAADKDLSFVVNDQAQPKKAVKVNNKHVKEKKDAYDLPKEKDAKKDALKANDLPKEKKETLKANGKKKNDLLKKEKNALNADDLPKKRVVKKTISGMTLTLQDTE